MGRDREFDEAEAVEAAMHVFWRRGYESTSLPLLLDAMSLSKSSFYNSFESKESLFRRCLDSYADAIVTSMRSALDESPSALSFIRKMLEGVALEAQDARGCLIMNTANEFGQRAPGFAELVSHHASRFESVFDEALARAEVRGEWEPTQPRRAVARYLLCALSGLKTLAKAGASRVELRESAQVAVRAIR